MNRRDFFSASALGAYSLVVLADKLPAAQGPLPTKRDFDRIAPPSGKPGLVAAEPHMTQVSLEADLLVAGGGLAGVCAAVSAARHGARVILVQDRSRLGGNSSSEVKMHVVGANCHAGRPGWREGGLIEEFRLDDAVNNPQRCWEMWDLLLYDKVVSEPNITLLLDTIVYSAATRNGRIEQVTARCDKTEHLYRIKAKLFLDCTGDSRLGLEAGAEMRSGREARSEFGESLAPEKADDETLGSSILFTSRHYNYTMPFRSPKWARKVTAEALRMRQITSWEYGYWWIEWGGNLSTIRDNERIRFELLSIVMGVWDYIKNSGDHPTSRNWALDWVGMMPGKRGSRRLVGDHILTQNDLISGRLDDAIAMGGWPMDDHPPGGFDRPDLAPATQIRTAEVYDIPYRSLYSRNIENLMMAGRNISASHVAFTSTRVMATCAVIGQAAGTAAALCLEKGVLPRHLYKDKALLSSLQQTLLRDDQSIPGRRNEDSRDLARSARITASGELGPAKAANLIDGWVRDIPLKGGEVEVHHWAAPLEQEGAWIELSWENSQKLSEIQITFDSGFQRELTLSASDSISARIVRAAQPETVRDYALYYRAPGSNELQKIESVEGNYQRLRRHRFSAVDVQAVRLHVTGMNGLDAVMVQEVRCFGPVVAAPGAELNLDDDAHSASNAAECTTD